MKQRLVKQTLDQQIKEQAKLRDQIKQEKIQFDQKVIENDQKELLNEKQKQQALQLKVLEAKKMRD